VNHKLDLDENEASGLAGDEDNGISEDFADKELVTVPDLARMTTKYTTIQVVVRARAGTTSKVSHLRCNMMSAWNLPMREEKESVSAELCRPKTGWGYMRRLVIVAEYATVVANV